MTEPEHPEVDPDQSKSTTPQWLIVGAVLLFVAAGVLAVVLGTSGDPTIKEGTWIVGSDVEPGTYQTGDAVIGCTWGLNGASKAAGSQTGRITVTIASTDSVFSSYNCGTWTKKG